MVKVSKATRKKIEDGFEAVLDKISTLDKVAFSLKREIAEAAAREAVDQLVDLR